MAYAEYNNSGPGFTPEERVRWAKVLSEYLAGQYEEVDTVLNGWGPTKCFGFLMRRFSASTAT